MRTLLLITLIGISLGLHAQPKEKRVATFSEWSANSVSTPSGKYQDQSGISDQVYGVGFYQNPDRGWGFRFEIGFGKRQGQMVYHNSSGAGSALASLFGFAVGATTGDVGLAINSLAQGAASNNSSGTRHLIYSGHLFSTAAGLEKTIIGSSRSLIHATFSTDLRMQRLYGLDIQSSAGWSYRDLDDQFSRWYSRVDFGLHCNIRPAKNFPLYVTTSLYFLSIHLGSPDLYTNQYRSGLRVGLVWEFRNSSAIAE